MKNKRFPLVRLLLCLAAVALALSGFASCGKKEQAKDPETTKEEQTTAPLDRYDEKGYKMDNVPTDLNYKNQPISILCWDAENTEFDAEYGDNVIDNAVYTRNVNVETRLNVSLEFQKTNASVNYVSEFKQKMLTAYSANEYWDIIGVYTRSAATLASSDLLLNLGTLPQSYLDFDQPWWSHDIIEKTAVGNNFYFVTGDISTNLVQMAYCIYFNPELLQANHMESPYDLVKDNNWTIENLLTMSKDFYKDNNNNETVDLKDSFGLSGAYYAWPALLHGCGVPIVEKDESGAFVIHSDFKGEKTMGLMKTFAAAVEGKDAYINASIDGFTSGRVAFFITESGTGLKKMGDAEFDYGCVPMPKYNAEQTDYCSPVRQPISLYGFFVNLPAERISMDTAVLECMASEAYRTTTPKVFDECMKYLRATSSEMSEMLTLIRDTAWFDFARIYSKETSYVCDKPGYVLRDGDSWESYVNGDLKIAAENLRVISNKLIANANR